MTTWPRPVPLIGDSTSAKQRASEPDGWAFSQRDQDALRAIVAARRDVRRFRPDDVGDDVVQRLLQAAHSAPSVGHSQPWRFIVVRDPTTRTNAALLADRQRIAQAAAMDPQSARQLLDLQLEGIREAPVGIVVCCDRRVDPVGVLGRATFADSDMWSCACAIQNLWLEARGQGLGVGWVTLFEPADLHALLGIPDGVETLGWLCVGYPDERQIAPGLERFGWSQRAAVDDVTMNEHWPTTHSPPAPRSRVAAPTPHDVVRSRDQADALLTPPGSMGLLDKVIDRVVARTGLSIDCATLFLAAGDHPVADLGVSAFPRSVTADVLSASASGRSMGATAAAAAGFGYQAIDAGASIGDLLNADAMPVQHVRDLVDQGIVMGGHLAVRGLVALGEVGIGNTTVAAALGAVLLDVAADQLVGLGSASDTAMRARKCAVVDGAVGRWRSIHHSGARPDPIALLASLGGPEFALLCGVAVGVARQGGIVVLDGMATCVAALVACEIDSAVGVHLVAAQRSNESGHAAILQRLGVEPLLDLRFRCGEGVGAVFAAQLILNGISIRRSMATTDV